jgi:hypothetical protein
VTISDCNDVKIGCRPRVRYSLFFTRITSAATRASAPWRTRAFDRLVAPHEFSISVLSRQKKNPPTISRSRSLASWAERRAVLGLGGNTSKAARAGEVTARAARPIALGRQGPGEQAQRIGDPG